MTIAEKIDTLMPEAIKQVSEGGFRFTVRQLFYKIRELYLKNYPNKPFYGDNAKNPEQGYNTFTQDYIPRYERKYGKIPNMIREKRGNYCVRDETNIEQFEVDDTLTENVRVGVSDKILVVEKAGFYRMLVENKIPKRFDMNIICLQGYTTEAGRKILKALEDQGFKILVLHDYDVNGVLINETLTRPTKRRDVFVENVTDLGFNWEDVVEFLQDGLIPEPVRLSKQDSSKLEGLLHRGVVSQEEYDFLKQYRVELNALTPMKFLEWLREKLRKLGVWKVIPSKEELEQEVAISLKLKADDIIRKELGIRELIEACYDIGNEVSDILTEREDAFRVNVSVEEFVDFLKRDENEELFWTVAASKFASQFVDNSIVGKILDERAKSRLREHVKRLRALVEEIERRLV